ncbi:Protein KIAA0556 homolog [Eumeta japonica]|uniref:Protein KIAA0556 homolog n=1 Tax=Eumeta variegata TaxID=151549 RepID=A0A4C1UV05_EUMVA|nr:Protein KIAA0556 homolog [Eumeta japonica]
MVAGKGSGPPECSLIRRNQTAEVATSHPYSNYNKSRIHSFRGVRLIQIRLDERVVFHGEVARASGDLTGPLHSFGDVKHVPLTGTDDSRTAQRLVNTAGGVVLPNQVSSNSFSPEPLRADEHYHVEE